MHPITGTSKNLITRSSEQWFWKIHFDGCFWKQLFFWERSWIASAQKQLRRYINFKSSMVTQILHFVSFLMWCYRGTDFIDFFSVKVLAENISTQNNLQVSFKRCILVKETHSLSFQSNSKTVIQQNVFKKFSIAGGTPRP